MKVIIAGGGSGGHVAPLLAVAEELRARKQDINLTYVGSKGGIEEKLIPQADIKTLSIHSGKFRRYYRSMILNILNPTTFLKNLFDFINFIRGIFDAFKILKAEDPDMVFLKGGYVSLPIGLACRIKRYPYFIHESDIISGLSNRILAKKARRIFVSYPLENFPEMNRERLIYSGNPLRRGLLLGDKKEAYKTFDFDRKLKTILILGGSQGARKINEVFSQKLENYLEKYQVIHLSGDLDYDWLEYKSRTYNHLERYRLFSFLTNELKDAYSISDLIISRAGNNALTEIAAMKKPAIIIPLESSAGDHQLANAKAYSREGAAYVMLQSHLTPEKLFRQADKLLEDPDELGYLSEKIHSFYKEDAAKIIAEHLINYYKREQRERVRDERAAGEKGR